MEPTSTSANVDTAGATVAVQAAHRADQARPAAPWLTTLDALRGLAALYVVCHHARTLLFISLKDALAGPDPLVKALALASAPFAFGHQAVVFFFVLSGFCIHYRQAKELADPGPDGFRFRIFPYIGRRVRRIVPPFYFGLAVTALLTYLSRTVNPSLLRELTPNTYVNPMLVQHNEGPVLLGNVLFLQSLYVPTFGNNTALWSLAYEFYLYLLYPLFLVLRKRTTPWGATAVVLVISAVAMLEIELRRRAFPGMIAVVAYWFCWVIGATAAEVYLGKARRPALSRYGLLVFPAIALWLTLHRRIPLVVSDSIGALLCAAFLLICLDHRREPSRYALVHRLWDSATGIGKFSYSLYLTHIPLLSLFCSLWFLRHRSMPTNPLPAVAATLAAVAFGFLAFHLVERRTIRS